MQIDTSKTHISLQSDKRFTPNHQINIKTGFLENPAFVDDFDSDRKQLFLSTFYANNGKLYKTVEECGVSPHTIHKHLNIDPKFKEAYDHVWKKLRDDIQGVLTDNALKREDPRYQSSLIFWLKKNFAEKYADNLKIENNSVVISVDSHTLSEYAKKVSEIQREISTEETDYIDVKAEKSESVDNQ
jgi:hypothetical protein